MTSKADVLATLRMFWADEKFGRDQECVYRLGRIDAAIGWVEGQEDDAKPATRDFPCGACGVTYVCEGSKSAYWLHSWQRDQSAKIHELGKCVDCDSNLAAPFFECWICLALFCKRHDKSTARVLTFGPNEGKVLRD